MQEEDRTMRVVAAPETTREALLRDPPDTKAIADFKEAGAIVIRGLITPEWLKTLRDNYARMADAADKPFGAGKPYGEGNGTTTNQRKLINRSGMWEDNEAFRWFLFNSSIARAAAIISGSKTARLY